MVVVESLLLALGVYLHFERPTARMSFKSTTGEVTNVLPGGAAERAGIQVHDILLRIDGDPVANRLPSFHYARPGQPVPIELRRGAQTTTVSLVPESLWKARLRGLREGGPNALWALSDLLNLPINIWMFILGVTILALRPDAADARLSSLTLTSWACGNFLATSGGVGAILSSCPPALRLSIYVLDSVFVALFFAACLHFVMLFPSTLPGVRRHRLVQLWPYLIAMPIFVESAEHGLGRIDPVRFARFTITHKDPFYSFLGPALLLAAAAILVFRSTREQDVNDRRRLKLVFCALAPGVVAFIYLLLLDRLDAPPSWRQTGWLIHSFAIVGGSSTFAYAVVRHRLFDIRLLVRRSIQYALARGTLIVLMTLPAISLSLFLYHHRNNSLTELVTGRPKLYFFLMMPIVGVLVYRRRVLDALDRRYFREQYDARHTLMHVVSMIRSGTDGLALAKVAAGEIQKVLHPKHVSLWQLDPISGQFRRIYLEGEKIEAVPLPATAAICTLLSTEDEPLELYSRQSEMLVRRLPEEERGWLTKQDAHLIVPLLIEKRLAAFLLLGERMSEEPYGREDRQLLRALAAQLSLTLDYSRLRTSPSPLWTPQSQLPPVIQETRLCPTCRRCFPPETIHCPHDQSQLVPEEGVPHIIEDKYEVRRLLGRGGMGSVFQATQRSLQRPVAIKILLGHLVASTSMRGRFEREARIVARLRHPGIVTIHDFGVLESGHAYLVMEQIEGQTLRRVLEGGPLSLDRTQRIMQGVGSAVQAAHLAGVVHRDLKPENIMITRQDQGEPEPKVLDFGLAKLNAPVLEGDATLVHSTQSGSIIGTLPYMAPELFSGHAADALSDQYSLGLIAYEALAGHHPFTVSALATIVIAHTQKPVPPLTDASPSVPQSVADAIHRALEKDPARRFESVAQFVEAMGKSA